MTITIETKPLRQLVGIKKHWLLAFCFSLFSLGFLTPFAQLCYYAILYFHESFTDDFIRISLQTLAIAVIVSILTIFIALLITLSKRHQNSKFMSIAQQFSLLGYAIPGTVLAIGSLIVLTSFDHKLNAIIHHLGFPSIGLLLSGSIFAIIFAFTIRFCSISVNALSSRLTHISTHLDHAAQTLSHNKFKVSLYIHLPLVKSAILAAALLVFIEVIKELPAALLLRPFNFEVLSTYVFQYISDEMLEHAALAAILITTVSMIPLLIINKLLNHKPKNNAKS